MPLPGVTQPSRRDNFVGSDPPKASAATLSREVCLEAVDPASGGRS